MERASHDRKAVITTYEAKHNHDVPIAKNSNHEPSSTVSYRGNSKIRRQVSGSFSLDLGVGIGHFTENRAKEPLQNAEAGSSLSAANNSSMMMVLVNGGLNPSDRRPPNLGRMLMGP